MTNVEAQRLLRLSREARWRYPTSSGRPIGDADTNWVSELIAERKEFIDATQFFLEQGINEGALEIGANVWRLWILSRDISGGRAFLAPLIERSIERTASRFQAS